MPHMRGLRIAKRVQQKGPYAYYHIVEKAILTQNRGRNTCDGGIAHGNNLQHLCTDSRMHVNVLVGRSNEQQCDSAKVICKIFQIISSIRMNPGESCKSNYRHSQCQTASNRDDSRNYLRAALSSYL